MNMKTSTNTLDWVGHLKNIIIHHTQYQITIF
jgi:hypothetical protein